uniref:Uncharacterized protein n=1 Tax=Solibacter usitatus (strain Ellin6076) TaxID=234267 RepID=Q01PZ0_SOLUE
MQSSRLSKPTLAHTVARRVFSGVSLLVFFGVLASVPLNAELLGTYTIDAYFNAGGCISDVGGGYRNPYYCDGPAPGPIFLNEPAGQYIIVVSAVGPAGPGNAFVWDGDAFGGIPISLFPRTVGSSFTTDHTFGDLVLYDHDWYAYDNNPDEWTQVQLFSAPEVNPGWLLVSGLILIRLATRCRAAAPRKITGA